MPRAASAGSGWNAAAVGSTFDATCGVPRPIVATTRCGGAPGSRDVVGDEGEGKSEGEGEAAFARSASCTGFTWAAPPAPGVRAGLSELAGYAARTASSAPGAAAPDAKAIADAHAASAPPAARVTAAMARVETMRRAFLAPGAPARAGPRAANAAPARRAAPLRLPPVTARRNRSCRT
ncbi:hypothetical protein BURPS1655_I0935 [Burkholderia pseudomallei 1655]|nr:hypothetical protein BURPS1655_I0935 [Burkholderia pseudomallei 1655]